MLKKLSAFTLFEVLVSAAIFTSIISVFWGLLGAGVKRFYLEREERQAIEHLSDWGLYLRALPVETLYRYAQEGISWDWDGHSLPFTDRQGVSSYVLHLHLHPSYLEKLPLELDDFQEAILPLELSLREEKAASVRIVCDYPLAIDL